ncbi:MAG: hypothetical protein ABJM06_07000 [Gilvibacter sp.]
MSEEIAGLVGNYIDNYCKEKGYQVNKSESNGATKYEISNRFEKISLMLYNSGKFVPGGSPKLRLRKEFDELKSNIAEDPDILTKIEESRVKSCVQKYVIIVDNVKEGIKDKLKDIDGNIQTEENPKPYQEYRNKIDRDKMSITVTQFSNGTLLLQGKEDILFNEVCDVIEKVGTPSEQEVVSRFLSHDEGKLQEFVNSCTPDLIETAEKNIKSYLGDSYKFLEPHDQKWFTAAECLRIVNIPLPEYSPVVMPASKAFEGFAKKALTKIGLFSSTHFDSKGASFSILNDTNHPDRKAIVSKERVADSFLKKTSLSLDMTRNFMMHSDSSTVTKVNSPEEASKKLDEILDNTVELFNYFNKPEFGGIYP